MRPNDIDNAKINHEYEYHLNRGKKYKLVSALDNKTHYLVRELKKAFNKKCFFCNEPILFSYDVGKVHICESCYYKEKERLYLNENL